MAEAVNFVGPLFATALGAPAFMQPDCWAPPADLRSYARRTAGWPASVSSRIGCARSTMRRGAAPNSPRLGAAGEPMRSFALPHHRGSCAYPRLSGGCFVHVRRADLKRDWQPRSTTCAPLGRYLDRRGVCSHAARHRRPWLHSCSPSYPSASSQAEWGGRNRSMKPAGASRAAGASCAVYAR